MAATPNDGQLAAARVAHAKLLESAANARAESDRWRIAFEREPTAQAHAEMVVAGQRATNAEAAAGKHEQDTLQPLEHETKRQQRNVAAAEIEHAHAHADELFRNAAVGFIQATRALDEAMRNLAPLQAKRIAVRNESIPMPPAVLEHFAGVMNQEFAPLRGAPSDGITWAAASVGGESLSVTIRLPVALVPGEFR